MYYKLYTNRCFVRAGYQSSGIIGQIYVIIMFLFQRCQYKFIMNITPNFFLSNEVRFASMKSWAGSRLFHTLAFEQNVVAKLMKKVD